MALFPFVARKRKIFQKVFFFFNGILNPFAIDTDTMELHVFCVWYVKHPKLHSMNTMAFLAIFSIFYSRKKEKIVQFGLLNTFSIGNFVILTLINYLFRPSSSKPEKIRSIFYEAEYDGRMQECHRYFNDCNISFLDLISNMISIESRKFIK